MTRLPSETAEDYKELVIIKDYDGEEVVAAPF